MIIEKQHNGSILISDISDITGEYYKQVYYGYSLKEAKQLFRDYLAEQEGHQYLETDSGLIHF